MTEEELDTLARKIAGLMLIDMGEILELEKEISKKQTEEIKIHITKETDRLVAYVDN